VTKSPSWVTRVLLSATCASVGEFARADSRCKTSDVELDMLRKLNRYGLRR
jgi:hypothetical protein